MKLGGNCVSRKGGGLEKAPDVNPWGSYMELMNEKKGKNTVINVITQGKSSASGSDTEGRLSSVTRTRNGEYKRAFLGRRGERARGI